MKDVRIDHENCTSKKGPSSQSSFLIHKGTPLKSYSAHSTQVSSPPRSPWLLHSTRIDPQTLLTCCLVSKQWNKVISACTEVWQTACKNLGWQIDDSVQDALHWKKVYLKAILRMKQLEDHEAFETSSLIGHSARVYALYYKDGLLCTGKRPWNCFFDFCIL